MSVEAAVEEVVTACCFAGLEKAECEAAYRSGVRHVPRLVRYSSGTEIPGSFGDGSGMIAGGLGGLGVLAAEVLVE